MGFDSRHGTFHHKYKNCPTCQQKGMYKPSRPTDPNDLHMYLCKFCHSKIHELDYKEADK